jgi:hypothetical protein
MANNDLNQLPSLHLTNHAAEALYTAVGFVRQNPWKTNTYSAYIGLYSKKMHIPFAHGPEMTIQNAPPKSQFAISLAIGDIVVCVYKDYYLLARITSEVKRGIIEPVCIGLDVEEHYRNPIEYGSGIKEFMLKRTYVYPDSDILDDVLVDGVEIIGRIVGGFDHHLTIASTASSGKRVLHFRTPPPVSRSITFGFVGGDEYPAPNV